jgi:hypothetical protein
VVLCGGLAVESRSRSLVKMTCETAKVMQRAQNMVSIVPASFVELLQPTFADHEILGGAERASNF